MPMPTFPLARLGAFRAELHACCTRRADALFDLADALLCAPAVSSVAQLSLEPAHRRGWGSTYAALASGRIEVERLRDLLAGSLPDADPLVFAVDVTTWPRCDAECSPERGYYYHPSRHSAGQPIIAGWAYQWIAQLGFDRDSWTAPVDAARLHPLDDTDQQAAVQVRALLGRLPDGGPVPLVVFDAGYDSAQLSLDLAEARVVVLVRLRGDRCLLRRPATTATQHQRPTAAPRRQVRLHRPDHLAGPDRHPDLSGRPVRHRDRGGLGGAASQAATPSRPWHSRAAADRARHRHPRAGPAGPGQDAPTQGDQGGRGRTWGPILVGVFGLTLVIAGVFVTDPALGYPPGTPSGASGAQTWHGTIHGLNGLLCFLALAVATLVFARRYFVVPGARNWARYSLGTGIVLLGFFIGSTAVGALDENNVIHNAPTGILQRISIVTGWLWLSLVALRELRTLPQTTAEAADGPSVATT